MIINHDHRTDTLKACLLSHLRAQSIVAEEREAPAQFFREMVPGQGVLQSLTTATLSYAERSMSFEGATDQLLNSIDNLFVVLKQSNECEVLHFRLHHLGLVDNVEHCMVYMSFSAAALAKEWK